MKYKIYLTLTNDDFSTLKTFIEENENDNLNTIFTYVLEKEDTDIYIRNNVYRILSDLSGFEPQDFNDDSDLRGDLGLSLYHKKSLKNYFQKVVTDLNSNNIVTLKECENLNIVLDCINLIKNKI